MKSVGDYLKNIRVAKNLTIEQAALVTKIGKDTLTAIEEAQEDKLPAKSYLRGFVHSYGKFLGADLQHLMLLFSEEIGSTNPEISEEEVSKETWKTVPLINRLQFNSKTYIIGSLIVLTAFAILGKNLFKKINNNNIASEKIIQNHKKPKVDVTKKVVTPNLLDTEKIKKPTIDLDQNITSKKIESAVKTPPQVNEVTYSESSKFPKELLIEANQDTSIKIKIGDNQVKMVKMLKGDFHTIKAKSKVLLETLDINDIKVIYNGTLRTANQNEEKSKVLNF